MLDTIKVRNLKKVNNTVFWEVITKYPFDDEVFCENFRTNNDGEGIFYDVPYWYMHQIEGTCDFTLKQKTLSGIRKALYKYYVG